MPRNQRFTTYLNLLSTHQINNPLCINMFVKKSRDPFARVSNHGRGETG